MSAFQFGHLVILYELRCAIAAMVTYSNRCKGKKQINLRLVRRSTHSHSIANTRTLTASSNTCSTTHMPQYRTATKFVQSPRTVSRQPSYCSPQIDLVCTEATCRCMFQEVTECPAALDEPRLYVTSLANNQYINRSHRKSRVACGSGFVSTSAKLVFPSSFVTLIVPAATASLVRW